jgi:hypothetical protein
MRLLTAEGHDGLARRGAGDAAFFQRGQEQADGDGVDVAHAVLLHMPEA